MINKELINPKSIAVIGGSNNTRKPGGKVVENLKNGSFGGELYIVNPKESEVQGNVCYRSTDDLPDVDLAILVIPAAACLSAVNTLTEKKKTKAFILLSAGFGEADGKGVELEKQIVDRINAYDGCLIGPNCIGVLNENYSGVFTTPIPEFSKEGCDLISSSGATAVFIMESGIGLGLRFANVFSVGNGAQTTVEDVLEYMDVNYDSERDSKIKLLYLESIKDPKKLLKHASSLAKKGVRIAAIKAGSTEAGSRAAASHTGAIASSDLMVRVLFKKAGIIYCSSREELISVASIFTYKELKNKNIAVITHAGGSAVMLTDVLASGGLKVPRIPDHKAEDLLKYLHNGSSVANPIDFLATGTAEQLGIIIDYCEHKFDEIDGMVVVFGSPGLFDVRNVYNVLSVKLDVCNKPIYPVLPSLINAQKEIQDFLEKGYVNFPDEVILGRALTQVYNGAKFQEEEIALPEVDKSKIREIIDSAENGFLPTQDVVMLLDAAGIPRVKEAEVSSRSELVEVLSDFDFPIAMKVVGLVHKSDVGGVTLNIVSTQEAEDTFERMLNIDGATGVLIQHMSSGIELFAGVKREEGFGHAVLCGLGGVLIEVLEDISAGLAPVSDEEIRGMIKGLKGYKLIQGYRGKLGVNEDLFVDVIKRLSALVEVAPEIKEMDINPLIGNGDSLLSVDARICIENIEKDEKSRGIK
jgi:acetyltransferase